MKNLYKQFLIIFAFLVSSFGLKAQISGPANICQNSSSNYTCSAAATYNWSVSPSGTETISDPSIQNPDISFSVAGNYTITVNTTSPVNTFTLGVSVNPKPILSPISNTIICSGNIVPAINFTTTPVGGVTTNWLNSNTSIGLSTNGSGNIIGFVSPNVITTQTGTITATATSITTGCSSFPISFTIQVNANPTVANAATITNPSCGIANGSLTGYLASGNGPFQYSWNGGFMSSSSDLTGVAAGSYTITANDANGCMISSTYNLSNPSPPAAPTTTDIQYCLNDSPSPLSVTASSGGTLTWFSDPSGTTVVSPTPNTTIVGVTSYYVSETLNGCQSPMASLNVVVNNLPAISISSNSPICENGTINLTANGNFGITYVWAGPNGFISTIQNPTISNPTVLESGTYSVSATDNNCSTIDSISIIVNPLPIINTSNNSPICENGTLNLMASGGINYSWSGPNGFTSNLQNPYITNTALNTSGIYTVIVTDANGCVNANFTNVNIQPGSFLYGSIFSNSTPITAGQVYLYSGSQGTTIYGLMATTNINASGQYTFTSVPAGDYIIKCIPDSLSYPTLINTYYGDVASWNLADTIHHDCSANSVADINVIEPVLMTGPGVISGYIIEGAGYGQRLINSNNEVQVPGGPLSDIDVNLVSLPSNTIVAQTISDFNGYYEFSNVAVGDYELQVDIPGLPMDSSYFIVITPLMFSANNNQVASSVFSNLDFVADGTAIYIANSIGIKQNSTNENLISVYPNPAKNVINIKFQSSDKITGQIEIIDNLGKTVASQNVSSELTQVTIEALNSGFYFVKVKSEKGINTFRFIKQ